MLHRLASASVAAVSIFIGLYGTSQSARSQSRPGFIHERDVWFKIEGGRQALWSGNSLVGVESDRTATPRIFTVNRQGQREELSFELPGASMIGVRSYACGFDGSLAVVGYAWDADHRLAQFITRISADRKNRIVIQVSPYVPDEVAIAGDGTIWTVGVMRTDNPDRSQAKPPVVKRFDASGRVLASFSVRAKAWPQSAPDSAILSHLFASRNRIGWFTNGCEYLEFSLTGDEIGRFDGPVGLDNDHLSGVGLDSENRLFLGTVRDGGFLLLTLDRVAGSWTQVPITDSKSPRWARILGFDGTTLVTTEEGVMRRRVRIE